MDKNGGFLLILISDKNQSLHLQRSWAENPPEVGSELEIVGEDMTLDQPGHVGAVLSNETRDFVIAHWNQSSIKCIFELIRAASEAKERKGPA